MDGMVDCGAGVAGLVTAFAVLVMVFLPLPLISVAQEAQSGTPIGN